MTCTEEGTRRVGWFRDKAGRTWIVYSEMRLRDGHKEFLACCESQFRWLREYQFGTVRVGTQHMDERGRIWNVLDARREGNGRFERLMVSDGEYRWM